MKKLIFAEYFLEYKNVQRLPSRSKAKSLSRKIYQIPKIEIMKIDFFSLEIHFTSISFCVCHMNLMNSYISSFGGKFVPFTAMVVVENLANAHIEMQCIEKFLL